MYITTYLGCFRSQKCVCDCESASLYSHLYWCKILRNSNFYTTAASRDKTTLWQQQSSKQSSEAGLFTLNTTTTFLWECLSHSLSPKMSVKYICFLQFILCSVNYNSERELLPGYQWNISRQWRHLEHPQNHGNMIYTGICTVQSAWWFSKGSVTKVSHNIMKSRL